MKTRLVRTKIGVCLMLVATSLSGCASQQAGIGGIPANAKPAEIQQTLKQQQAQRASYYKQHPQAMGQGPGTNQYAARMGVIPPNPQPGEVQQAVHLQAQQQAAFYKTHPHGHL